MNSQSFHFRIYHKNQAPSNANLDSNNAPIMLSFYHHTSAKVYSRARNFAPGGTA